MGEAPGAQEDATGRPMVGRAGRQLGKVLKAIGLSRDEVMILNRVRCRPPGNQLGRYPDALLECEHWTQAEFAEYKPHVVVLMGKTACEPIFGKRSMGEMRGEIRCTGPDHPWPNMVFIATYHPAASLRPKHRDTLRLVAADLAQARDLMCL